MEELDALMVIVPSCPEDLPISNGTQIVEEGPRVCPLCRCEVKLFFINFQEQIMLCENVECQYPFGYEDLQFKRLEDVDTSDMASVRTRCSQASLVSPTGSMISTHAWSEIDKINEMYDEDSQCERPMSRAKQKDVTPVKLDNASMNEIKKNVASIRDLNSELKELSEPSHIIQNEKWIKKLFNLQSMTKEPLLKPQEMQQIEEENKLKPTIKIDIQPGDEHTISAIQINIA